MATNPKTWIYLDKIKLQNPYIINVPRHKKVAEKRLFIIIHKIWKGLMKNKRINCLLFCFLCADMRLLENIIV